MIVPMMASAGPPCERPRDVAALLERDAVVMDTHDMTVDTSATGRRFPELPNTAVAVALESYFRDQ